MRSAQCGPFKPVKSESSGGRYFRDSTVVKQKRFAEDNQKTSFRSFFFFKYVLQYNKERREREKKAASRQRVSDAQRETE